jgi:hypothetical protein
MNDPLLTILEFAFGLATFYYAWDRLFRKRSNSTKNNAGLGSTGSGVKN